MKSYMQHFLLFLAAGLIPSTTMSLYAQQPIQKGTFTIGGNTYEITKLDTYSLYVIGYTDKSELRHNKEIVDGIPLELARTQITNREELQRLACEAIGKEKREQLITRKEKISGWIDYRADGTVIGVVFTVDENTTLTLDDLARIDNTLKKSFKASLESKRNLHQHLYHISFNYEWDFGK